MSHILYKAMVQYTLYMLIHQMSAILSLRVNQTEEYSIYSLPFYLYLASQLPLSQLLVPSASAFFSICLFRRAVEVLTEHVHVRKKLKNPDTAQPMFSRIEPCYPQGLVTNSKTRRCFTLYLRQQISQGHKVIRRFFNSVYKF